jgi:UDP-N-acetylmuramyl pentapeptide phosphotransferase/UDP-N-acetylglucosamine-1-phosphate transferase
VAALLIPLARAVPIEAGRLRLVIAIALAVAAASLLDDLRGLPARLRLVLHAIAAIVTVWGLDVVGRVAAAGVDPALAWTFGAIAAVWIVAFVNAFNFMDGIDGIAAGQSLVAGLGWIAVGAGAGDGLVVRLAASLTGASAGFLLLNWSPARLFMGDVGSAFLGYLLAILPLAAADPLPLAGPALLLVWPFLFDTAFTLVRRARRGEDLLQAHRSHLYQRLTQTGLTHAPVAAAYILLAAAGIPAAWALATGQRAVGAAGILLATVLAVSLWRTVAIRERRAA